MTSHVRHAYLYICNIKYNLKSSFDHYSSDDDLDTTDTNEFKYATSESENDEYDDYLESDSVCDGFSEYESDFVDKNH